MITEIAKTFNTNGAVISAAIDAGGVKSLHLVDAEYGILVYPRDAVEALDVKYLIHKVGRRAGRTNAEYVREWQARR